MILNLVLLFGACVDSALNANKGAVEDPTFSGDTAVTDGDSAPTTFPAWYAVSAELTVAKGVATVDAASVTMEVVDSDLEGVSCLVELSTDELVAGAPNQYGVELWWDLPVSATDSCAVLPVSLSLGIGALDSDVRARLGTAELEDVADSLYGAYLRADGGDVWSFGYAGTAADLAGDGVAELPPPDGAYLLAPLYLAALPEQPEE